MAHAELNFLFPVPSFFALARKEKAAGDTGGWLLVTLLHVH